jgi:hypothetical protein
MRDSNKLEISEDKRTVTFVDIVSTKNRFDGWILKMPLIHLENGI